MFGQATELRGERYSGYDYMRKFGRAITCLYLKLWGSSWKKDETGIKNVNKT